MVLKAEPALRAIDALREESATSKHAMRILIPSPQGRPFTQQMAEEFRRDPRRIVFICGHYEGFDERVRQLLAPDEISIGDYILGGGEVPAMVVIDAVARLIPGVLGDEDSNRQDSFSGERRWLEFAQYTRPREYRGLRVPEVLVSGNHEEIAKWRETQSALRTEQQRSDLWAQHQAPSSPQDKKG